MTLPSHKFWSNKTVLLTGHTGFKGGWLALWLATMGARVAGFALPPTTTPNLFAMLGLANRVDSRFGDIRDAAEIAAVMRETKPQIVFHLAAQPLVRAGYAMPLVTFQTNVMGTAHILEAVREVDSVEVALTITTDKVYRNREWSFPYRETDHLGGHDPYSASKAAAELVATCYRDSFLAGRNVRTATARAGNVIGGGDWSCDRLIPDAIRAWDSGNTLMVRRPAATRPWQHVLDPLSGYLVLAEKLFAKADLPTAFNFGPGGAATADVRTVVELARRGYGRGEVTYGDGSDGPHEANLLALDTSQAQAVLGVKPRWPLDISVQKTMSWYRAVAEGGDAWSICQADIAAFEQDA